MNYVSLWVMEEKDHYLSIIVFLVLLIILDFIEPCNENIQNLLMLKSLQIQKEDSIRGLFKLLTKNDINKNAEDEFHDQIKCALEQEELMIKNITHHIQIQKTENNKKI